MARRMFANLAGGVTPTIVIYEAEDTDRKKIF